MESRRSVKKTGWLSRFSFGQTYEDEPSEQLSSISRVTQLFTPSVFQSFWSSTQSSGQNGVPEEEEERPRQTTTVRRSFERQLTVDVPDRAVKPDAGRSQDLRSLEKLVETVDAPVNPRSSVRVSRRKTLTIVPRVSNVSVTGTDQTADSLLDRETPASINKANFSPAPFQRKRAAAEEQAPIAQPPGPKRARVSDVLSASMPGARDGSLFSAHSALETSGRSSALGVIRPRFGSVSKQPTAGLSSQTKRILQQLEKMNTPVKDAWKLPAPNAWKMERRASVDSSCRLRGPPLSSIKTPTRAQVLSQSRALGSIGSKPYWPRPSKIMEPVPEIPSKSLKTASTSRRTEDESSAVPELPPVTESVPLPMKAAPSPGFLSSNDSASNSFTFSKPLPFFAFSKPTPLSSESVEAKSVSVPPSEKEKSEDKKDDSELVGGESSSSSDSSDSGSESEIRDTSDSATDSITTLEQFKEVAKWKCPECHANNPIDQAKCVQCSNAKSTESTKKTEADITSWACKKCKLDNNSSTETCICCNTHKDWKPAQSPTDKAPSTSWTCGDCFVSNKSDASKCVCCGAQNPTGGRKSAGEETKSKWTCDDCFVPNTADADKCVCCQSARPGASTSSSKPKPPAFVPQKFGETETTPKPWSCTTCFVSNQADKQNCVSCQSPKPGNTFQSVKFGFDAPKNVGTVAPTFGIKAPENDAAEKKTVRFAVPIAVTSTITPLPFGSTPSTSTAAPVFGIPNNDSAPPVTSAPTALFGFGAATTAAPKTEGTPFASLTQTAVTCSTTSTSSNSLAFGLNTKPTDTAAMPPLFGIASTAAPAVTTASPFAAGLATTGNTKTTASAAAVTPVFSFGATNVPATSSSAAPVLKFGNSTAPSSVSLAPTTSSTAASIPAPLFAFGQNKTETPIFPAVAAASKFEPTEKKPLSLVGLTATTTAENKPFVFPNPSTTTSAPSLNAPIAPLKFGAPSTESAQPLLFGGATTTTASAPFNGFATNAVTTTTSGFSFGTNTNTGGFNFGAAAASTAPLFGGNEAKPASTFNFGGQTNSVNPAPAVPNTFSFGASKPEQQPAPAPAAPFMFGGAATPTTNSGGNLFNPNPVAPAGRKIAMARRRSVRR